jgi:CheY-like chemotaxis protein
MTIFYIDNDPDDCQIFSEVIRTIDPRIKCLTCMDSEQGLRILKNELETLPDLVFLDINMPRKDGVQCLMEIRNDEKLKDLPIIMFSTSISEANKQKFTMHHALYLAKPMTLRKYTTVLREIIEQKNLTDSR